MNDQIKKSFASLKQFWSDSEKPTRRKMIFGAAAILVIAAGLSIFLNIKDYVVIYDRLNAGETSEILAQLQQMSVDVKVDAQGAIMVPKKEESKVRMSLAQAGYPKSGLSYYMIEQGSGLLTTDFERQQYVALQLQERIAASIKTLDGVRDAIVTITVSDDSTFYLHEKEPPSASVIIHMETGTVLGDSQVAGIQNLVTKAVTGLTKDNVAISDSSGNSLISAGMESSDYSKINLTRQIESDIHKKVLAILEGPYGRDRLRVSVTAELDTDDLFQEERIYSPSPEGENRGVISQETRSEESSSSPPGDGGIPGTDSNAELPGYPIGAVLGESEYNSSHESTSYLVNQVISQFQKDGAKIASVSIGIAIDKEMFEADERERIQSLVAYAVGITPDRIAVENFRFFVTDRPETPKEEETTIPLLYLAIGGAALFVLLALLAFVLLRRRRKKRSPDGFGGLSQEQAINELFGEEVIPPIAPVRDTQREQIKEFAQSNPEIAAQMIRSWLKNES